MRRGLYRRLAADGIRKNGSIYLPYFLTCTGMVMMFYIVAFLAMDPKIRGFEGGATLQSMLGLGVMVMGIFAFIFLIYTSSFLMRRSLCGRRRTARSENSGRSLCRSV